MREKFYLKKHVIIFVVVFILFLVGFSGNILSGFLGSGINFLPYIITLSLIFLMMIKIITNRVAIDPEGISWGSIFYRRKLKWQEIHSSKPIYALGTTYIKSPNTFSTKQVNTLVGYKFQTMKGEKMFIFSGFDNTERIISLLKTYGRIREEKVPEVEVKVKELTPSDPGSMWLILATVTTFMFPPAGIIMSYFAFKKTKNKNSKKIAIFLLILNSLITLVGAVGIYLIVEVIRDTIN